MKILMTFKHYPMCGGNFFKWAMQDLGHEVISAGMTMGDIVPWHDNPRFPKYNFPPDIVLPDLPRIPLQAIKDKLPWKPDLILEVDAGFYMDGKPKEWHGVPIALFATDPHFLDYTAQYCFVDYFFNPQPMSFAKYPEGIFLPWAHDPNVHKMLPDNGIIYDMVFVGALYEQRKILLEALKRDYDVKVAEQLIYDECTKLYNEGLMSFNMSSNDDIPMRIFEGMGYGTAVVTNRITGLDLLFKEGVHYIGYDGEAELLEKMKYYTDHLEELKAIMQNGMKEVEKHTYKIRCQTILDTIFK